MLWRARACGLGFSIAAILSMICVASDAAEQPHAALRRMTIEQLQADMSAGRTTSRELVEYFLARIEAIDRGESGLNAVIELNSEALLIADQLDAQRRAGPVRGSLHGIPVMLKDNIDTADTMSTTAGSLALVGSKPVRDAVIVERLRNAGAVILGKTNLSEWANWRSTRSSSGWSARGGQTRNAHARDRNPCGSSSGSAVAVAAGLTVVAVGTETVGSIVCPAAVNGIVGVKPTVGLVSQAGIVPISRSQDTAGPMARSVADAAILLDALADKDAGYAGELRPDGLKGARIGVARNLAGFHEGVDVIFEHTIARLAAAGAVIVDPANLDAGETLREDQLTLLLYEFKDGINRYLAARPGAPQTLTELIGFNERERAKEMLYFGQELFLMSEGKGSLEEREYLRARARARRAAGPDGIDKVLRKHRLDAIVAPTAGPAWTTDLVNGDNAVGRRIAYTAAVPAAVSGYPHITVPAGFVHGLPVGVSFIGTAWSERTLIRLAFAFEQSESR